MSSILQLYTYYTVTRHVYLLGNWQPGYGALHGAIARKMFTLLRRLIKEGAPVDSVYARMTPLCAVLTFGKERSGDVRMVRLLPNAKADVNKKTFGPRFSHRKRELTHLEFAKEYSNENCLQSILAK